jgi:protease IV
MNISPDYLIERKRNKSQLAKWKISSLILVLVIVFITGNKMIGGKNTSFLPKDIRGEYIANILLEEIIYDDLSRVKKLEKIAEDKNIKAVIIHINSPGGSVVGSEMLYNSFRKIAKNKPVVAVMDSVAASGGYLIALGADYIVAHNGTITGSIGVLMEMAEITELAEKIGVKFNHFKSNTLKANPGFTEKLTPEAEKAMMDNVFDVYDYFTELVAKRRGLDLDFVRKIADGRIYSAKLAMQYKLINEIGNEDSAIKWLEEKKDIEKNLKIFEVKLNPRDKIIDMFFDDIDSSIRGLFSGKFLGLKSIL